MKTVSMSYQRTMVFWLPELIEEKETWNYKNPNFTFHALDIFYFLTHDTFMIGPFEKAQRNRDDNNTMKMENLLVDVTS